MRAAGVPVDVIVPGVDETCDIPDTGERVLELARRKGEAGRAVIGDRPTTPTVLIAADTMLDMGGVPYGKPHSAEVARQRLHEMSGSSGTLYTGHHVAVSLGDDGWRWVDGTAATTVRFATMTDDEIEAYLATGEPLEVAGSFTIDGFGGPFIEGIDGDHHNVVGLSLPLVRHMLAQLGVQWTDLWDSAPHHK